MELVNQMKAYGDEMGENRLVEKILACLPQKFKIIVSIIEETRDVSKLGVAELMGSLKSFEQRRHSDSPIESAFQSKLQLNRENQEESSRGGRHGKARGRGSNGRSRGKPNFERRFNNDESSQLPKCNFCKKVGHLEKDC